MIAKRYVCLALYLLAGAHAYGQFGSNRTNPLTEFKGKLIDGNYDSYSGLVVEAASLKDRMLREHADVASDGTFTFRNIAEGEYQLHVLTLYGDEIASTITAIGPATMAFEFRLPQKKLERPSTGSVSIYQLNHPPSKQVRKLLESGQRLIQGKHYDDAAARFREATQDAPDCAQAHADLGLALSKMGDWETATQEFRAAVSLDPRNSTLHSNLGAALAATSHFDEAEHEAQTALKLDPRNSRAHFVMGGSLLRRSGSLPEAVSHLVAAQDSIPSARVAVEKICATKHVASCP